MLWVTWLHGQLWLHGARGAGQPSEPRREWGTTAQLCWQQSISVGFLLIVLEAQCFVVWYSSSWHHPEAGGIAPLLCFCKVLFSGLFLYILLLFGLWIFFLAAVRCVLFSFFFFKGNCIVLYSGKLNIQKAKIHSVLGTGLCIHNAENSYFWISKNQLNYLYSFRDYLRCQNPLEQDNSPKLTFSKLFQCTPN